MPPIKSKAPATTPAATKPAESSSGGGVGGKTTPVQETRIVQVERPILYDKLEVKLCIGDARITVDIAKQMIGWESQKDYTVRMLGLNPKLKPEEAVFGDDFALLDEAGEKVQLWNNKKNRDFDRKHAYQLGQDILNKEWRINLENIIISNTGLILSGQHRLIALILAAQKWATGGDKAHWHEKWSEEPYIESSVGIGVGEEPEILRTLDNVKPRSLSDVYFTSPLFSDLPSYDKKECSRMMDRACDLLWKRTGAGIRGFNHYQTHSTSMDFTERHPKLLEAVRHMFTENKNRAISNLKLSAGQCAAMLYMMGSSSSDGDAYFNADSPNESMLDWENWDAACAFWASLVKSDSKEMIPVRLGLGALVDEDSGAGGRLVEKMAVLAKAWNIYQAGEALTEETIELEYKTNNDGVRSLDEWPDFGGIDRGEPKKTEGAAEPTPEEVEAAKEKERQDRAAKQQAKVDAAKKKEEAKALKAATPPTPQAAPIVKPVAPAPKKASTVSRKK